MTPFRLLTLRWFGSLLTPPRCANKQTSSVFVERDLFVLGGGIVWKESVVAIRFQDMKINDPIHLFLISNAGPLLKASTGDETNT